MEFEFGETGIRYTRLTICNEGAVVVHLAVDEVVVRERRSACRCLHNLFDDLFIWGMIPIAKQDWSNIIIVGNMRRTMNNHGSSQASSVLSAVVRVIPGCPVEISEERISETLSGSNWALLNGWNAIEPRSSLLQYSVPMQSSAFFGSGDVIAHVDRNGVSPIGFDGWSWVCSVDEKSAFVYSIGSNEASSDVEIVSRPRSCKSV